MTKLYVVTFFDSTFGDEAASFDTYEEAKAYWNDYKNTGTCEAGMFVFCTGSYVVKIDSFFKPATTNWRFT